MASIRKRGKRRTRHRNDGLHKVCGCPRRTWAKCPHPWHFNFQHEGRHYRLSLDKAIGRKIRDKTTARIEADALKVAIRDGKFGKADPAPESLTLKGLGELYFARHVDVHLAPGTRVSERSRWNLLMAVSISRGDRDVVFGDLPAAAVAAGDIEAARAARMADMARRDREAAERAKAKDQPAPPSRSRAGGRVGANRTIERLRHCYNWAIDHGYVDETPFRKKGRTTIKKFPEAARHRRLAEGEEARLLAAASPHLQALITAALDTGCRKGELLALQWEHVSLTRNELHLPAAMTKARKERFIPLTARLRAMLEMRRTDPDGDELPGSAYVFGNDVGERVATIKTAWQGACRRAGISGLAFHDLRREAGSRLLEGQHPLPQQYVRDFLGHANISTTSRYLATDRHGLHRAFRRHDQAKAAEVTHDLQSGGVDARQPATGDSEKVLKEKGL